MFLNKSSNNKLTHTGQTTFHTVSFFFAMHSQVYVYVASTCVRRYNHDSYSPLRALSILVDRRCVVWRVLYDRSWLFESTKRWNGRLIDEVTFTTERHYNGMHTTNRDPVSSRNFYADMAGAKGLKHIFSLLEHLSAPATQQRLGMTTSDTDIPIGVDVAFFKLLIEEDSLFLNEIMNFALPLAGLLLRRALWHQEGLPGYGNYNIYIYM